MTAVELPPRWPWLFKLFRDYAPKYVAKHLHAVRIAKHGQPPQSWNGPAIMVMNHPSWWDPMLGFVLCKLWPNRLDYAPIDAAALKKYKFLGKVGLFGIEPDSLSGAKEFLRIGRALLQHENATLWITAQGEFTDVRVRPVALRPGVGHLAAEMTEGVVIPMALEYPFWNERSPEALVAFGELIDSTSFRARTPRDCTSIIAQALEATMDRLRLSAESRDANQFTTFVMGKAGVGGVYDLSRRLRALVAGRRFRAEHAP